MVEYPSLQIRTKSFDVLRPHIGGGDFIERTDLLHPWQRFGLGGEVFFRIHPHGLDHEANLRMIAIARLKNEIGPAKTVWCRDGKERFFDRDTKTRGSLKKGYLQPDKKVRNIALETGFYGEEGIAVEDGLRVGLNRSQFTIVVITEIDIRNCKIWTAPAGISPKGLTYA